MNPFFNNINIFLARETIFFLRKLNLIYKSLERIILKSSIFMEEPIKSREILLSLWEIYQKTKNNGLDRDGLMEVGWKFWKILDKIDCNL